MVIFHSYVKLPEGITKLTRVQGWYIFFFVKPEMKCFLEWHHLASCHWFCCRVSGKESCGGFLMALGRPRGAADGWLHMDFIWTLYWLVVTGTWLSFVHILGMASSQLTFIFFRGVAQNTNQYMTLVCIVFSYQGYVDFIWLYPTPLLAAKTDLKNRAGKPAVYWARERQGDGRFVEWK